MHILDQKTILKYYNSTKKDHVSLRDIELRIKTMMAGPFKLNSMWSLSAWSSSAFLN